MVHQVRRREEEGNSRHDNSFTFAAHGDVWRDGNNAS